MTNEFPQQIPPEMREFAGRSVAQARKAFEGFIDAVAKSRDDLERPPGMLPASLGCGTASAARDSSR